MPALWPPFLLTEGSQGCPSSSWQAHLASGRPHWEAMKAASLWPLPGHMPTAGRNRANESLPTAPPPWLTSWPVLSLLGRTGLWFRTLQPFTLGMEAG